METIDDIQINVQLGLLSGDSPMEMETLLAQASQPLSFRTDSNWSTRTLLKLA